MRFFLISFVFTGLLFFSAGTCLFADEDASVTETDQAVAVTKLPDDYRNPFNVNPLFVAQTAADALKPRSASVYKGLTLEGIAMSPEQKMAVINGQTYFEGQIRDSIEVVAIRKTEVDIKEGMMEKTLKMNETTKSETGRPAAISRDAKPLGGMPDDSAFPDTASPR